MPSAAELRVTIDNGRKRVVRSMQRDRRSWEVLIYLHSAPYPDTGPFALDHESLSGSLRMASFFMRILKQAFAYREKAGRLRQIGRQAHAPNFPLSSVKKYV